MKFSAAALALSAAGLVSAKSVQNKYAREVPVPAPVEHKAPAETKLAELPPAMPAHPVAQQPPAVAHPVAAQPPVHLPPGLVSGEHIIIIWMNPGGGAETTTVNQQVTVTETVIVPGATPPAVHPPPAAAPPAEAAPPVHPPAAAPPPAAGSPTHPDQATPAAPGVGATHSISVGGPAGLVFAPDQIKAAVGDMVIFTYYAANHTATQSTFAEPCKPLAGGMDSGFIPNPDNSIDPPPQVAMQVMVPDALWFYCAQGPHCGKGMVFSINPTAERTHAMFQSMAIAQNGNGAAAPIVGGAPAPAPSGAPPAEAAPPAAPPASGLPPLEGLPPAATESLPLPVATPPAVGSGSGVVEGIGRVENGACVCSVQCNMGSFPALDQQGVGAIGGIGGSIPMGQPVRRRW
ncbi:hypothetical protein F5X68DRAFT_195139 [Plectosphaerella plurivora]|uniref:Uncharacterized protein n=1 Tax=Plectosphaerella plurivora TaxID=936078 RepID=A0A9P9A411_9PEZI|nr:hypothetical protein F5X68DRAFT_195139 [Plectosphaerella plurivora]